MDGSELPSARIVSFMMHHDVSEHHSHINILLVFWGQMVDHDMTLAAQTVGKFLLLQNSFIYAYHLDFFKQVIFEKL